MSNDLLKDIVEHFGSNTPEHFINADISDLMQIKGLGKSKATLVHSIKELCVNIYRSDTPDRYKIRSIEDAAHYMIDKLRFLTQEHFVCLYLNTKNQVIGEEVITVGTLNSSLVHPREIFKHAIRLSAASVICFHNHPSNDTRASDEDIDVTKRLVEAGKLIGIELLDHIIVADRKYSSLKMKGYL